jgi:hypothetical protein
LQHQGDPPVRAGRPSLLSPDEQAAPERQGILSSLDGMQVPGAAAPTSHPRSRALAWGGAAAGALVVGAALFLAGAGDERQTPFGPSATPPAVALAAAPGGATVAEVPRPAPVAMPAPATPTPTPAVLRDESAPAVANPLADMAPSPASVADVRDPVTHAPERTGRHKAHGAKAERKDAHAQRKVREATHEKPKTRLAERHPKARTVHEADSDVVLLAALVSHIEPKTGKATPAEQLEACRRYNAAGEAQCRARVCATAGRKEAACKDVQAKRTDHLTADD